LRERPSFPTRRSSDLLLEKAGATVFSGFAGMEVLYDGSRVVGVRTDDKGIDKHGKPKANFQPGYDLRAKVTVFAEGPRGSLTKQDRKSTRLNSSHDQI